jgi:hypothetical protein
MWNLGKRRDKDLCAEMNMVLELFLAVVVFEKMTALIVLDYSPLGVDWIILCSGGICFEEDHDP